MSLWQPSVTVAAVIERDGKFLLVEELQDGRRVLNQPAGHLDPEETLIDACARADSPLDKEILGIHWLNSSELKKRAQQHRSPLVQQCVDDYLAGCKFPLTVLSKTHG